MLASWVSCMEDRGALLPRDRIQGGDGEGGPTSHAGALAVCQDQVCLKGEQGGMAVTRGSSARWVGRMGLFSYLDDRALIWL